MAHHILDEQRQIVLGVIHPVDFVLEIAGKYDSPELFDDVNYHILVRLTVLFQLVNIPVALVIVKNIVYQSFNFFFKGCHNGSSPRFYYLFIS